MIVTCPNCQTRYNLPDAKVPPGGAKVKCSKCAHVFKAEPPATPEEEVETLLEEETPSTPDTSAGDAFDETFDEVSSGGSAAPAGKPDDVDAADEAESGGTDMDDLFGDDEGEVAAPGGDADVDSLFGDADDLFADDGTPDEDPPAKGEGPVDDIFADDADDADDLFAGDDEDEDEAEEEEGGDDEGGSDGLDLDEDEPVRSRKPLGCLIVLLVLALLIGGAVWLKAWRWFGFDPCSYIQNVPYVGKLCLEETGGDKEAAPGESPADRVRNIVLKNVKQYYVANEKTGNLFVVEGKAVNQFTAPKERIKVEVVLYDGTGNVLTSQAFLCGNLLSQFQLQVQTRPEIEDGLKSEVGVLSNNTFIRPGSSTPFMAVFFDPPAGVKEFLVKVVDVGDPK
ncbi:DUF3426 domain-containing protein [Pseudodesulfovibrio sp.]|uniref:DUF3426 domain-containing protein n=1 Tax=Pseudodesulfovibrio sp. TaxID=2035812 RepID=UPI00262BD6B0|nr:DUF3426 domain-containing protein [Pseudodesulfovibrio sp.]MDD3312299.1 DUF3426 domain-containing protein [Pseudodesulfovibrio sp.]